jgi:triphosphatase
VLGTLTEGRRPISTEFELKLAAPAAKLEKLRRALQAMPTVKSEVRSKLVSTYYDTPALALHRERLSFRVRQQGPEFVQTIKAENPAQADVLERKEWEDQNPSKWPVLDASRTGKRLPDGVRDEELRPVFTNMVTRTVIEISPDPSARIEAAID